MDPSVWYMCFVGYTQEKSLMDNPRQQKKQTRRHRELIDNDDWKESSSNRDNTIKED
jgi:hypothetical protein